MISGLQKAALLVDIPAQRHANSANEASKLDLITTIYNRAKMLIKRGDGKQASSILDHWIDLYGDNEDILKLKDFT